MKHHILITGATGMVGRKLINELHKRGHTLSVLSRKAKSIKHAKVFTWDIYKQEIDPACLDGVDTIIHLAGEGIADKKWTKERKQQIIDSRVLSTNLLYKTIKETNSPVKSFISASAVGYYGNRGDEILSEESTAGSGFLAECCELWEDAVDEGKSLNIRIAKIRVGIVLSKGEGALASLEKPIKFFVGAPLGTGKQWMPWIHIDDIVAIFTAAAEQESFEGPYNASAPFPVTNSTLTNEVAKCLSRPVWPIKVPEKVLEMILGKMSIIVTLSTNTTAQKLLDTGFQFKFTQLNAALKDIYK